MCPDLRRANCQRCGKHRDEAGSISWEGLCRDCAIAAVGQNIEQMMDRRGPNFDTARPSLAVVNANAPTRKREALDGA
jgi:hypothetical protein